MSAVARRGFLRLLAAAPIAAPVIAREAASKAGVTALGYGAPLGSMASAGQPIDATNDWIKKWAAQVFSAKWKTERWDDIKSQPVGALDPDLACSRSLSISAAVRIQRERNFERSMAHERRNVLRRFKEELGFDFIPETSP